MSTETTAIEHLKAELRWLWYRLQRELRRLQADGILPPADTPFPGTAVSPLEIEARLRLVAPHAGTRAPSPGELEADALVATARDEVERLVQARAGRKLPLLQLREAFELDAHEYHAVLLALGLEHDPGFARLYAYLQNHFDRPYPTLALLIDALIPPQDRIAARGLLDPEGRLVGLGLVHVDRTGPAGELHRGFRIAPRIARYVAGDRALDDKLVGVATIGGAPPRAEPILGASHADSWRRLRLLLDVPDEMLARALPVIVLRGPEGIGKKRWTNYVAARLKRRSLFVDLRALPRVFGSLEDGLRAVMREARLHHAIVGFERWESLLQVEGDGPEARPHRHDIALADASRALDAAVRRAGLPVLLLTTDTQAPLPALSRSIETIDIAMPDLAAATALWSSFLPQAARHPDASPVRLAESFRVTPGQMRGALERALQGHAGRDEPVLTVAEIGRALKELTQVRLGSIAHLVSNSSTWDDLILPPDVAAQLAELCHRYRHRVTVLERWGLGRRFGHDLGVSALFEGPPGTGKTMSASIIARELGLDLYQIDLSKIVSKYIGETEKNLERVFDEAERSGAMLLFDEADSLFSRRTNVQSSNDRYANLEVNYLLQRMERFSGIAILTTNFADAIDQAFARRLATRITFPRPSAAERERLWRSMLASPSLPKGNISAPDLAYEFEISGGLIRNAVLRAAFFAAARATPLDMDLLRLAARIEMKEQGMLVRGDPHRELTPA